MSEYVQPNADTADLESQHQATWSSYNAMQPTPGWQQASIDAATAAARAKFALDKANGYTR